jgi:uncharacterized protein YggT (Ycf19 family)
MNSGFWSYWYFHIPNFILAAIMYTMIGRLLLSFFVADDWDNYIWRAFKRITDPAVRIVRGITPAVLPLQVVLVFAVLWLMAIRVTYLVVLLRLELAPTVQAGG